MACGYDIDRYSPFLVSYEQYEAVNPKVDILKSRGLFGHLYFKIIENGQILNISGLTPSIIDLQKFISEITRELMSG
jgi:hypothetical protein